MCIFAELGGGEAHSTHSRHSHEFMTRGVDKGVVVTPGFPSELLLPRGAVSADLCMPAAIIGGPLRRMVVYFALVFACCEDRN